MAFVHPQSCECTKTELDLFAVPPTQTSIESGNWVEYIPISALAHGLPIEFNIIGSGQDYVDLANTQLYVKVKITRGNDQDIDGTDHVAPINLTLHSLFSEVDFKLNDTLISSTNNMYPYRAYLETLLSYGEDAKKSQLTSSLYYKDVAGHMEEADPTAAGAANSGMVKRNSFFLQGRTCELLGGIHCDMMFQERYLPSDVGFRLRFVRSKDAFSLLSDTPNVAHKIKIEECKLYVRKVKLSPSLIVAHAKAFEVGNAKYPVRRVVCKTFTVSAGNMSASQENLFSGDLPSRMVITMVDNDAFSGLYTKNPFNLKHYDLNNLKVYIDGQQQYIRPLEFNYTADQYIFGYMSLFSGTGKERKDEGGDVSREDFSNGYALYAFDLTPDLGEGDHFNLSRDGTVRVDMSFRVALPNTINVIVYAEFQSVIELDRNRNVICDFTN